MDRPKQMEACTLASAGMNIACALPLTSPQTAKVLQNSQCGAAELDEADMLTIPESQSTPATPGKKTLSQAGDEKIPIALIVPEINCSICQKSGANEANRARNAATC